MPIGLRILPRGRVADAALIERFKVLPVANVSDSMSRMTAGGARIRPFYSGSTMAGPAVTVKARPGDNLMVHKALDLALPGDVVVVDAGGDLTNAIIGELMVAHAVHRRLGGIVINGAIRDSDALSRSAFPVFAAGVTHRGPYKDGPGEINTDIAIDGMVIQAGDVILGDADGFLCVPLAMAASVAEAAEAKFRAETAQMERIRAGFNDKRWVDEALARLGCSLEQRP